MLLYMLFLALPKGSFPGALSQNLFYNHCIRVISNKKPPANNNFIIIVIIIDFMEFI